MLITLSEHSEAPRIQSWLIREGVASRLLDGGRLLLVDDPFIPHHLLRRVDADPAVLRREDTHDLPRRVLYGGMVLGLLVLAGAIVMLRRRAAAGQARERLAE